MKIRLTDRELISVGWDVPDEPVKEIRGIYGTLRQGKRNRSYEYELTDEQWKSLRLSADVIGELAEGDTRRTARSLYRKMRAKEQS